MKITFFARTERKNLELVEFYRQDIAFLREFAHELSIATRWREINWGSDLIFIWWWTYAFVPVAIGKILHKKIIITGTFNFRCPDYEKDYFKRNWLKRILIKFSVKNASYNVLVSQREYEALQKEWKLENIYYSPHIVDVKKYQPLDSHNDNDNFIFTLCGMTKGILRRKCIFEIIEAMRLINKKGIKVKLIIAGRKGNGLQQLESMIDDYELNDTVEVIGEVSEKEKIDYFQRCTIYLQPSKFEGFGLAIAEAMSCGAPVISTDVGAVREVVGDAGVLLDNCSPENIADAITRLLANSSVRKKLSIRAREKIVRDFPPIRRKNDLKRLISS